MASVRKRGDTWQAQVRKQGHLSLTRTFTTKANAQAWARRVESEIERRVVGPNYGRNVEATLGSLIARYLEVVTPRKKSFIQETNRLLKLSRLPIARVAAGSLTAQDIAKLRDERLMRVGGQAVRHDLNALSHVYTVAIREWDVGLVANPVHGVWKPAISASRERRLTPWEGATLMDYLTRCPKDLRDFIVLALETGMRKGEIFRIDRKDVNVAVHTLAIPITKNGSSRIIPLSTEATKILINRSDGGHGRLFPYDEPWCRYHWRKLLKETGILDLHFHDLRHESISRFFERGLSVPEVALISGHKDYRMLARYTHLRAEDVAKKFA